MLSRLARLAPIGSLLLILALTACQSTASGAAAPSAVPPAAAAKSLPAGAATAVSSTDRPATSAGVTAGQREVIWGRVPYCT